MSRDTYIIENSYISKEFHLKSGRISSYSIFNKISGKTFVPQEGSEEFTLQFKWGLSKKQVLCSSLNVSGVTTEMKNGEILYRISFKPFSLRDSKIKADLIYIMKEDGFYLRKYLQLSFHKKGNRDIILDCIEFERVRFDASLRFWTLPKQRNSHIPGFTLSLGQPVYIDSLYMGCEFPAALNKIEDYTATVSYYSGKPLSVLIGNTSYESFRSVVGGSEGDIFEQIQKSFFAYIKDISKPNKIRRQYNSWYDNMLNITKENIYNSFLEVEKGLTASGEPPLDSYVADDGWNDYSKGFWSFNKKFPDELYPFKKLAKGLGSDFGLWVGPRGGYTSDTPKFAQVIERAGNGYYNKNARDICVASDKYVHRMTDMMVGFIDKFSINYYKLDGFAQYPCKSRNHDHMTGGYKNMYFYTDVWEKWLKAFEELNKKGGEDFWINLTCYAAPSPWYLQWVNSLWIQISDDVGFIGNKKEVPDKDRMLSYRDERYFDFYHTRQFQFPQSSLYNHDPIYGNEAKASMTDDEFRSYLFTMATRGNSFWELYYSYSMMNEAKWRINHSALRFINDNKQLLSHSVIFGGRPSAEAVYGYSCFDGCEGIVSVRNSSGENKKFTFRLDELIGVKETFADKRMYQLLPYTTEQSSKKYSYSDTVSVSLEPYETKIFHFGKKAEHLKAEYVKARDINCLEVQFNQFVDVSELYCDENPIKAVELLEDYMSVYITFENSFDRLNNCRISGVSDIMGNKSDISVSFDYFENYEITDGGICGKTDFTVIANINSSQQGVLFRQGSEIELFVGCDGLVSFRVGFDVLKSETDIKDIVQIAAVRERNGVLKLYVNKTLDSGMPSTPFSLSGESFERGEGVNIKAYNKAFSYDEV